MSKGGDKRQKTHTKWAKPVEKAKEGKEGKKGGKMSEKKLRRELRQNGVDTIRLEYKNS